MELLKINKQGKALYFLLYVHKTVTHSKTALIYTSYNVILLGKSNHEN